MPIMPATNSPFDIEIDDIGLMLYSDAKHPKTIAGGFVSSVLGDDLQHRDVPIEQADWSAGLGHGVNVGINNGYSYGLNICSRIPGALLPAGELTSVTWAYSPAAPTCAVDYGADTYVFTGSEYVIKLPNKTGAPQVEHIEVGYSFTSAVVFDGKIYAAAWDGTTVKMMLQFDGTNWTRAANTVTGTGDVPAFRIETVTWFTADNVPSKRLVRLDTTGSMKQLASGANPMVATNWSGATTIGDTTYRVNKLVASDQHLFALKPDGIHDIEAYGLSPCITPYWADTTDTNSGQCGVIYDGRLIATHIMGVDAVDLKGTRRDKPTWCGPGVNLNSEGPIKGRATAFLVESGWLVGAFANFDTGTSYILYGKFREDVGLPDFPAPIVWHGAEAVISGSSAAPRYVTAMHVVTPSSSTDQAQLLIFSTDGTTVQMHRLSIPREGTALSDWAVSGAHRFNPDASVYLTRQTWGSPASQKFLWRYEVEAENIEGSRQLLIYANPDLTVDVLQGQMTASPRTKFNAQSTASSHIVGHTITGQCSNEQPWILRSIRVRAEVAVEQSDVRTYDCWFGGGIELRGGAGDQRDPDYVWSQIVALMNSAPVTMRDHRGRSVTVRVLQGVPYGDIEQQADHWAKRAQVHVRVLAYQAAYDTGGDVYDADATYEDAA